MILNIKGKILKNNNILFLNTKWISIKIDYFIGNYEIDLEKQYYVLFSTKLDNKNKIEVQILLSNAYEELEYFVFLNSVELIGIKTTQRIFDMGINEFIKNIENKNNFILKNKYKLSEKQIENILKKIKKANEQPILNNKLINIEKQLIFLGYKKNIVNKILIDNYNVLIDLENEEIIRFMIKELSYYESKEK